MRCTAHRLGEPALACAVLMAAMPMACGAAVVKPFAVTFDRDQNATVRVRVRAPAGADPDMSWSGTAQPFPYRLALTWPASATLELPPPALPAGGVGPVQAAALRQTPGQTRLELQLNAAIQPSLRRVGDSWEIRLEPAPTVSAPLASLAAAAPVAAEPPVQIARAQTAPPSSPRRASRDPEMLLLDMTVNGERQAAVARAEQWSDGALLVAGDAWTEARLAPSLQPRTLTDGTPAYELRSLPGVRYRIDRRTLSLDIDAPPTAFVGSTLRAAQAAPVPPPSRPEPGVMVNYDVSLTDGGSSERTGGAALEAVAFGPLGSFVMSGLVSDDGTRRSTTRLDSYWRYDMPERMETLVVGDTLGVSGGWSRPVRYAGVRWGRDFGLRPGFVTLPQVSLSGQAALPSTVEVLVNNVQRVNQSVQSGPFDLQNIPVVTGAGEINLVVRDLLGRETIIQQSYYASPRLLAPGLSDFSVEAGWMRTGYGRDSHYEDAFAAGTLRSGWTPGLTGELRLELQADRQAAGTELSGLLGDWASGRAALAVSKGSSQDRGEGGHLLILGIEHNSAMGGASLQYERASRGFAPFGEAVHPAAAMQRAREQWLGGVAGRLWGTVAGGINYVRQKRWSGEQVASLGLSLSAPLARGASLSFAVNKRLDDRRGWNAGVQVNVPLQDGIQVATRVDRLNDGQLVGAAAASRNAPAGPGLGWRAEASTQPSQRARGGIQYNTAHAELALDLAADADGQVAGRGNARGTVGVVAGVPFATRPVRDGSVAVVQVGDLPGVPVKRSNQVVAYTDDRGLAFLPGLVPWHRNQIEIDPTDLPMNVDVRETVQDVVPYARSGAVVRFDARRSRQALVVLHQSNGAPVPVGAQVRLLPEGTEFLTGRRGEVWLTGLASGRQRLRATWSGGACELAFATPGGDEDEPGAVGPLTCGGPGR